MPNIKPISDLRSYSSVLDEVSQGAPVFLTKNGRGRYVIVDIKDFEKIEAEEKLFAQLNLGIESANKQGTLTTSEVESKFEKRFSKAVS